MGREPLILLQSNWIKIREDKNRITLIILKSEIYFALVGGIINLQKKQVEQYVNAKQLTKLLNITQRYLLYLSVKGTLGGLSAALQFKLNRAKSAGLKCKV